MVPRKRGQPPGAKGAMPRPAIRPAPPLAKTMRPSMTARRSPWAMWAAGADFGERGLIDAAEIDGVDAHIVRHGVVAQRTPVVARIGDQRDGADPVVAGGRGAVPEGRDERRGPGV